jgi:alpha-tubulin suppressor-like RCC1 family protein
MSYWCVSITHHHLVLPFTHLDSANQSSCDWTETGNLFVWGTLKFDTGSESTNKLYRPFSSPLPVLIEELKRETIIQIAAGAVHLLVLTNKGRVYSWGTSTYGRLGREGAPNQFLPIHDHKFNKETHLIQTIACGDQHNVVMDQAGNVFTWGRNMNMQCGFTSERAEILKPTFLPDVSKKMIKKVR